MIKLLDIYKQIFEAKQVGVLYHFCGIDRLINIIDSNQIGIYNSVSFTRNKIFDKTSKIFNGESVRIKLDGDKISNNYKIYPYHWGGDKFYNSKRIQSDKYEDQQEEQIDKPLKNASNYILETTVKEIDLWDYLDEDHFDYIKPIAKVYNKEPEELSYNDLEQYLLDSKFKVKIV